MKKWLRRIALTLVAVLVLAVLVGSGYEWMGRRLAVRDFPPPGTLVDVGGRRLHLDCRGSGAPTVVLVSGLDINGAAAWSAVHDSIAATSRTCAYSRAGIMWSDPSPDPVTARGVADDLHATLTRAGERPPFVLVGHSLGGPYIMTYTREHGAEVAGLVMVDASHPDQMQRMAAIAPAAADPSAAITPMRIAAALSWTGIVRAATSATPRMPNQDEANARAISAYASHSIDGALKEMDALAATLADAGSFRQLGDRPLFVLSAMRPVTDAERATLELSEEEGRAFKALWRTMQEEEAAWSSRSQHRLLDDASHYIQYDRPDAVIEAVRSVVDSVRATPATPATAPTAGTGGGP
jgi:pimeloyl-ACP methyl ester carboxylesterase